MTVKIGLIGDVHATAAPVWEALAILRREGVAAVLCPGDIAGYGTELGPTVELLAASGCRAILGNHDLWWLSAPEREADGAVERYLRTLPTTVELSVAGKRLYMVHGSPRDSLTDGIRLLDEDGTPVPEQKEFWSDYLKAFPFDVLVVGHTHQVFAERLGNVLVVNPGSTRFNHTCAVLTLPEMELRIFPLGGRAPVPSWNWGWRGVGPGRDGEGSRILHFHYQKSRKMKICPFCAEEIQEAAVKCKHCGEFLGGSQRPRPAETGLPWYFRTSTIVIALLCVGPLALPLIWWRPKMTPAWKIGLTIVVLLLSWILYQAAMESIRTLNEYLKMLDSL